MLGAYFEMKHRKYPQSFNKGWRLYGLGHKSTELETDLVYYNGHYWARENLEIELDKIKGKRIVRQEKTFKRWFRRAIKG